MGTPSPPNCIVFSAGSLQVLLPYITKIILMMFLGTTKQVVL